MAASALDAQIARLRLDAPQKTTVDLRRAPLKFTAESTAQFRECCLCMRRHGIPAHVLRGAISAFCLLRRTPRAPHPTHRRGHPLPPLVQALYRAKPAFRGALEAALEGRGRVPSGLPRGEHAESPCARNATNGLLKLFEAMDVDCATRDPSAATTRRKATEACRALVETARLAGTTLNVDSPADWFRLAHVVLSCLPAAVVQRSFVGICGRVDRYRFPDCGHQLEEVDDAAWIQQAPAERCACLIEALRARPAAAPLHGPQGQESRVRCPTCGAAGPALHESFPRFTSVPAASAPHLLWVIILRSSGSGLSRHRVALPSWVLFDGTTGQPRALLPSEVPPRGAVVYSLAAVMLYHSKKERGDPPAEFDGDSGGRYSICVHLGADGFHWLADDDAPAKPVRGVEGVALLETHCHSAFYDAEDAPSCRRVAVGDVGG